MKKPQTNLEQKRIKSLISTIAKRAGVPRNDIKEEYKKVENPLAFYLESVRNQFDRNIRFVTTTIEGGDGLAIFKKESYDDVLHFLQNIQSKDDMLIPYNTVLAIYDTTNDVTWFGFSPAHDVIGIDIDDKILVSPYLPF